MLTKVLLGSRHCGHHCVRSYRDRIAVVILTWALHRFNIKSMGMSSLLISISGFEMFLHCNDLLNPFLMLNNDICNYIYGFPKSSTTVVIYLQMSDERYPSFIIYPKYQTSPTTKLKYWTIKKWLIQPPS